MHHHDQDTSGAADDFDEDIKSKSQIKREMAALQQIGKKLTELKPQQLAKVPMSEDLAAAIELSKKITQREASRRHLHYIGKLMRSEDAELIQNVLDEFDSSSKIFNQRMQAIESWRSRLIEEGNDAVTEFINEHPEADMQHLRQLVRNAKKEVSQQKNTGHAKKLFQYIKEIREG